MINKGSLNQVTLVGRLGKDPEIKTVGDNLSVARFSLATTQLNKDKNEVTQWHNITAFGHAANFAGKYLKKGNLVMLVGSIAYESWENDEGEKQYMTKIYADSLIALPNGNSDQSSQGQRDDSPDPDDDEDDDLPF